MRTIFQALLSFVGCFVCAVAAIFLVNLLPNAVIEKNLIQSSAPVNHSAHPLFSHTFMDWWTECELMTSGLYRPIDPSAEADASDHRDGFTGIPEADPVSRAWHSAVLSPNIGNCKLLHEGGGGKYYYRYWMGGQVVTRPMLYLSGVNASRIFTVAVFFSSIAAFLYFVDRHAGTRLAYGIIALLAVTPFFSQLVILPHASAWIIGFLGASLLMKWGNLTHHGAVLLGLWSGMLVAFFDILNNPIAAPMALTFGYFVICYARSRPPSILILVLLNGAWFSGFAGFWASKWLLAAMALGPDAVIANIGGKIGERAGLAGSPEITWRESLYYNGLAVMVPLVVFAGLALREAVEHFRPDRRRQHPAVSDAFRLGFFVLPVAFGALPVVWIVLLSNHSAIHHFFVSPILIWSALLWFFAIFAITHPKALVLNELSES